MIFGRHHIDALRQVFSLCGSLVIFTASSTLFKYSFFILYFFFLYVSFSLFLSVSVSLLPSPHQQTHTSSFSTQQTITHCHPPPSKKKKSATIRWIGPPKPHRQTTENTIGHQITTKNRTTNQTNKLYHHKNG